MSWKILAFSVLGCLITSDAERLQGEGIVEGDVAGANDFPYQVAFLDDDNVRRFYCGGGIIDDYHIISAAHCFVDRKTNQFKGKPAFIIAGTTDLTKAKVEGVTVKVQKIYIPLEYNSKNHAGKGDIAVIKLNKSLNLSKNKKLKQLKLPQNLQESYANKEAKVAGHGWTWVRPVTDPKTKEIIPQGGAQDYKLKYLKVDVLDSVKCRMINGRQSVTNSHMCAKAKLRNPKNPSGTCYGDSGGPLVYGGDTIIGVVSYGTTTCREHIKPTVYTRISAYLNFIENARKDLFSFKTMRMYAFKN